MTNCNGITKKGKQCKARASINGYCTWHQITEDCPICIEKLTRNDPRLPCGHWVHRECIQKHADAMQDLRQEEGYPPLHHANCPVCRAIIPDIKPKDPEIINEIAITARSIAAIYNEWCNTNQAVPLSFFIWMELCTQYPTHEDPDILVIAAQAFAELVDNGSIPVRLETINQEVTQPINITL